MSNYHLSTYETAVATPSSGAERIAAMACHGALFLCAPLLLPLAVFFLWPLLMPPSAYVRHQAWQAFLFHALFAIVTTVLGSITGVLIWLIIIGWPFAIVTGTALGVFWLWSIVIMCIGTWKSMVGQPYSLPIVGSWEQR